MLLSANLMLLYYMSHSSEESSDDIAQRFTMFGCWNNGICNPDAPGLNSLSRVFDSLMRSSFNPEFYIVAGDNYYPTTTKVAGVKSKALDDEALTSGFTCLTSLADRHGQIPVYLLMGNHDLQEETDFGEDKECDIITAELESARGTSIDVDTTVKRSGDTVFIFLDTNLYEGESASKYARCELIYRDQTAALHGLDKTDIIERITGDMERDVIEKLDRIQNCGVDITNIFVVGHHPILGLKRKLNKDTGVIKKKVQRLDDRGAFFIGGLFQKFPVASSYYLCADIHQYQEGFITIEGFDNHIRQFTVGTGGAELDEYLPDPDSTTINGPLSYHFQYGESTNGYLQVHREGPVYEFNFIPLRSAVAAPLEEVPCGPEPSVVAHSVAAHSVAAHSVAAPSVAAHSVAEPSVAEPSVAEIFALVESSPKSRSSSPHKKSASVDSSPKKRSSSPKGVVTPDSGSRPASSGKGAKHRKTARHKRTRHKKTGHKKTRHTRTRHKRTRHKRTRHRRTRHRRSRHRRSRHRR